MSDGPGDSAEMAHSQARLFAKKRFPKTTLVSSPSRAPVKGRVVLVYEEYINYIVELVEDRKVLQRWRVSPNWTGDRKPVRLIVTSENYNVGALE